MSDPDSERRPSFAAASRERVLMVHNRYQQRGGEDESFEAERDLLRGRGHEVVELVFDNDDVPGLGLVRTALGTVWSPSSHRRVLELVRRTRPDVMHVQNFFPLASPAIHHAARETGVPVVQSLRNYRLMCANSLFFRNGRICEACTRHAVPWPAIRHGCYRGSRAGSSAVVAMQLAHRVIGTWHDKVDLFVALSAFAKARFEAAGLPAERIVVKPNFVPGSPDVGDGEGGHALFVGRLAEGKGIEVLLEAMRRRRSGQRLDIIGTGPLDSIVRSGAESLANVRWLGRRPRADVMRHMAAAAVVVVPTEAYETFGRVVVEAFSVGTPVVVSRGGAVAELVDPGRNGLTVPAGDAEALAAALDELGALSPDAQQRYRRDARASYDERYTASRNYDMLRTLYRRAMTWHRP